MSEPAPETDPHTGESPGKRRWALRVGALALAAFAIVVAGGWFGREEIADLVIEDVLADYDLPASYEIVEIGPSEQVLANIVVGDTARPDLVIERAVIGIDYTLGLPGIGDVTLVRPRLHASYREGVFSMGALDPLLEGEGEPGLPGIDLTLVDARALIETDYGRIGVKAEGSGPLDDGFSGILAASAPGIGSADCRAARATLYGKVTTAAGAPSFAGPLRLGEFECGGARLENADIALDAALPASLDAVDAGFDLAVKGLAGGGIEAAALSGEGRAGWSDGVFNLRHDLALEEVDAGFARLENLTADGALRSIEGFAQNEWDAQLVGKGLAVSALEGEGLAAIEKSLDATPLGPLAAKFARAFRSASAGGALRADLTARIEDGALSLFVPEARLASGSGETILGASRVSWSDGALRGNVMTGGAGLPRISGRMEQAGRSGDLVFRLAMAPYEAGSGEESARLAVPRMELRQTRGGLAFVGLVEASGPLPGGRIEGLRLPLAGTYDAGRLAVGRRCTALAFERLAYADLELGRERVTLCPDGAGAMLAYDETLRLSLAADDLALEGSLGDTRLRIAAERAGLFGASFALNGLDVVLGEDEAAVRLAAATLTGVIGDTLAGEFAGGTAALDAVPLDVAALSGGWRYEDGVLALERGAFLLTDRTEGEARFEPLIARDAVLTLEDGAILAEAALREPASDALVTRVSIRHDLETAQGRALIDVPGVAFGDSLAPDDLTILAKGVVAEVEGVVTGEGIVEWDGEEVTSSGRFRTDDLDLAAAFGPVAGLAGEIVFTDLLNLTTAPGQVVTIAAINPGVEVIDGRVAFALDGGQIVQVEDARWPFMGGTLIMRPVVLDYGSAEEKAYVFEIVGLEAERFVTQMELTNLSATGTFDGTVPIVFDGEGNGRIEGGLLISRPPGGNVSYIGELTYEDMGAMANFAFNALRSLDYNQMAVALEGNLAGEIITRFTFDGVRQGEGASRNFVTRRLGRLPIRFKVNVRSENFHELATMVRSFWDADYIRNPVDRGLLRTEEGRFVPRTPAPGEPPQAVPEAIRPEESPVQPPESEDSP
ncbi:YdbH domain-containing protein [Erythrobacter sp.]|uniref:intermembrane phospholipid transport protein YdbH family protein n=1 Tax=Erythrobacter sp. TaxID=1042 RepID=UPI001425F852|nr:YdbH domain-containing protein [Erythrobacter sp.]QIQ85844.1 MAG: exoprotein [Erythrobacter sp.]